MQDLIFYVCALLIVLFFGFVVWKNFAQKDGCKNSCSGCSFEGFCKKNK